ncbi:helix-turn-helix transcriptional regulator [Tsuneonella dongtanensis]|uniref:helix-turn-helix transcriptional regulator n=1 Tax=Tsuneonella dongtanensis TaxID=692370 RepID=UPI0018DBF20A|nr:helix-turn-helix transcriptional regulator [Tsuneonella dongtanensis]
MGDFGGKLAVALKAISLSRVAAAQALGVDKSLVGRWLSGSVHPTEHNLARLTSLIAERQPGFRMADWDGDLDDFAGRLGIAIPKRGADPGVMLPHLRPLIEIAREEIGRRGGTYEGFFRTARPSLLVPDTVFHEYGVVRRNEAGLLDVAMRGSGLLFEGWALPAHNNLFVFLYDSTGLSPLSIVFRGVALPKAMVLEGIMLLAALDAGRTPAAMPVLLERVGDLSDDPDADFAAIEAMERDQPPPMDPVSDEEIRRRLFRDAGPMSKEAGTGDRVLAVTSADGISRGAAGSGLRG